MTRRYVSHRRAYAPRMWPMIMLSTAIIIPIVLVWRGGWWIPFAVGSTVGGGVPLIRGYVWRRRHPVVKFDQWVQAQRDAAPWN